MSTEVPSTSIDFSPFEQLRFAREVIRREGEALQMLEDALEAARITGRESVFAALGQGSVAMAAIDEGQTLWRIYDAVVKIEGWWTNQA